jgi:hypothetical protein
MYWRCIALESKLGLKLQRLLKLGFSRGANFNPLFAEQAPFNVMPYLLANAEETSQLP